MMLRVGGSHSLPAVQPTSQSPETGALPIIKAATDPTLTGQGFKYFGPFYKGPINANIGNEGRHHVMLILGGQLLLVSKRGCMACCHLHIRLHIRPVCVICLNICGGLHTTWQYSSPYHTVWPVYLQLAATV